MKKAFIFLLCVFGVSLVGLVYGWYLKWAYFNTILHFLGGLGVALFFISYFAKSNFETKGKKFVAIVGAVALIGVLWEFAEFTASTFVSDPLYDWTGYRVYFMGDLVDTVSDLAMDLLGGMIGYLFSKNK